MTSTATATSLDDKLRAARAASIVLATTASGAKDAGLEAIATAVENGADRILPANELDLANGRESGLSAGLQDRLRLDDPPLAGLAAEGPTDSPAVPEPAVTDGEGPCGSEAPADDGSSGDSGAARCSGSSGWSSKVKRVHPCREARSHRARSGHRPPGP